MSSNSSSSPKVAIVTGAASGIGKAIALRLAKDGFNVTISDLASQFPKMEEVAQQCSLINPEGKFLLTACDVSQEDQVQKLVDDTVEQFGRLDCMVANAGIGEFDVLANVPLVNFNKVMAVNVNGTLLCYRAAAKAMIACNTGQNGRIIGACSLAGKRGVPLFGAYCASKFAVRALTQTAAIEYGTAGITVNAYAAGFVETALVEHVKEEIKKASGVDGNEFIKQTVEASALKRLGTVDDIANLVSFLASDQSSYITGQCISIDGGCNFD